MCVCHVENIKTYLLAYLDVIRRISRLGSCLAFPYMILGVNLYHQTLWAAISFFILGIFNNCVVSQEIADFNMAAVCHVGFYIYLKY